MIETIAVARMLREAVTTPYLNLVTRPTGVAVRGRIESVLATSEWETAMLDFSDVVLLDLSCADEVVAKLVRMAKQRLGRIGIGAPDLRNVAETDHTPADDEVDVQDVLFGLK